MANDEDPAKRSNEIRIENDSDSEEPMRLDLGIDPSLSFSRRTPTENAGAGNYPLTPKFFKQNIMTEVRLLVSKCTLMTGVVGAGCSSNETPRREDNPFSFKHFLRSDTANYQSQGARPKVYCGGRQITSVSDLNLRQSCGIKQTRVRPVRSYLTHEQNTGL